MARNGTGRPARQAAPAEAWLGGASHGNGTDRVPRSQVPGVSAPLRDLKKEDFEMKGIPGLAK